MYSRLSIMSIAYRPASVCRPIYIYIYPRFMLCYFIRCNLSMKTHFRPILVFVYLVYAKLAMLVGRTQCLGLHQTVGYRLYYIGAYNYRS